MTNQYKKLKKQPLIFALAEIRFSKILSIESSIAQFQEKCRKQFPKFSENQEYRISTSEDGPKLTGDTRWSFISADLSKAIELSTERLVVVTSKYGRFPEFLEDCRYALDILSETVSPNILERVGLRYGDMDELGENENIDSVVDDTFNAPPTLSTIGGVDPNQKILKVSTESGSLNIKFTYGDTDRVTHPDLRQLPIQLKKTQKHSRRILLDFDHYWLGDGDETFDANQACEVLANLHAVTREAFWSITTDHARNKKWN